MTNINATFKIGNYMVTADANFSGRGLNTIITIDGIEVERSSSHAIDYYTASGLRGAALEAYDQKWLKDYATNAIMSTLMSLIDEKMAAA